MAVTWIIDYPQVRLLDVPILDYLMKTAEAVAEDARAIVPVDTGALKAGIHVGNLSRSDLSVRVISTRDVAGDDPKVPLYVERGTSKMAAQPYLRPALYRTR